MQADLYSYARTKLIRLADVVGRRSGVEPSPCNSAALSMSPWPRPAVWPPLPADGEARAAVREQENVAGKTEPLVKVSCTVSLHHRIASMEG